MSMENPNVVLIKAITVLYINRALPQKSSKAIYIAQDVCDNLRMPQHGHGEGGDSDVAHALKITLEWLLSLRDETTITLVDLKERVRLNCNHAIEYLETIDNLLSGIEEHEPHVLEDRVNGICAELQYALKKINIGQTIANIHRTLNFSNKSVDLKQIFEDLDNTLREYESSSDGMTQANAGEVDFDNPESIEETFRRAKESLSHKGLLRTGLQGLNKGLGVGGFVRGLFYNFGALTHNYKTGILLNACRWVPLYNTPYLFNENKKPLVLRVSFENKPEQDLPELYKSLYEAEFKIKVDKAEIDPVKAAKYIKEKLEQNGFHFKMVCFDPNNMSVWDLIDILKYYDSQGYEIQACIVDYIELITKGGNNNLRSDEKIVFAIETMRNYCFANNITCLNAHQLSTEAQALSREGTANFAVKVSQGGWYMNCKSLHTKLDGEILMHILKRGDKKYLTFGMGKNRTSSEVSEYAKSFAYEFEEFGGINDDVLEEHSKAIYKWSDVETADANTEAEEELVW